MVNAWADQVLCMITEYHLTCVVKGPKMASPILPEALDNQLPPRENYRAPNPRDQVTNVRVVDNKARTLRVGVWLHRLDLTLRGDEETAQSLLRLTHTRGPLLRYFVAPGTANLHHEEVIDKVLEENYQAHERAKDKVRASLTKCMDRRAKYYHEQDELLKRLDTTSDDQLREEFECRKAAVQSYIRKLESSMATH